MILSSGDARGNWPQRAGPSVDHSKSADSNGATADRSMHAHLPKKEKRAWRPFTAEDDAVILQMRSEGRSMTEIGRKLDRRACVIDNRIKTLMRANGEYVRGMFAAAKPWSDEEDRALIGSRIAGMTYREIGETVLPHRGHYALKERYRKLVATGSPIVSELDDDHELNHDDLARRNARFLTALHRYFDRRAEQLAIAA